jgi:hypothetical protein
MISVVNMRSVGIAPVGAQRFNVMRTPSRLVPKRLPARGRSGCSPSACNHNQEHAMNDLDRAWDAALTDHLSAAQAQLAAASAKMKELEELQSAGRPDWSRALIEVSDMTPQPWSDYQCGSPTQTRYGVSAARAAQSALLRPRTTALVGAMRLGITALLDSSLPTPCR